MRRVMIAGATSGIGLKVAERLAVEGNTVGIAGRKDEVMKSLASRYPGNVVWEHIDITDDDAPENMTCLIDKMGGMDVYFHVSGVGYDNPDLEIPKEMATMQTNVGGFTRMVDAAFRYFRDECGGNGHIAAITSVAGTNGIGCMAAYSSSKKFQQTYLRALNQLATSQRLNIRFTDIRPGWIRTPLLSPSESYPMEMTVDYAVDRILRALNSRRRVAVVDWRWNILVGLWRLVPNALWVRLPVRVGSLASFPAATEKRQLRCEECDIAAS